MKKTIYVFYFCVILVHTVYTQSYKLSSYAGNGNSGFKDSTALQSRFYHPHGMCIDAAGNLILADGANHSIRKISPTGIVTTIAGGKGSTGDVNGIGTAARFWWPSGICIDKVGNIVVTDVRNEKIKKISPLGVVTTFSGSGGEADVDSTSAFACFDNPVDICMDIAGNFYVADADNNKIRKIDSNGKVTTFAGTGIAGSTDGVANVAQFDGPYGLCFDLSGNLIVADWNNNKIRKITPAGVVSTLAGTGNWANKDGASASASFQSPNSVRIDKLGNIYVSEGVGARIRKISTSGMVSTIIGNGNQYSCTETYASASGIGFPNGMIIDTSGKIFISTSNCHKIKVATPCTSSSYSYSDTFCAYPFISYIFDGRYLDSSGIYRDTLENVAGCDSFVTLNLFIKRTSASSFSKTICVGSSYFFNGQYLTTLGRYYDTLTGANGCDSVVTLTLNTATAITTNTNVTICSGKNYLFNGQQIKLAGTYRDTLQSIGGCDSFVNLILTISPIISTNVSASICQGSSYLFKGINLTDAGTYYDTIKTSIGCDSVVKLNLIVNPLPVITLIKVGPKLQATAGLTTYKWKLNGNNITGSSSSITASQNGSYMVEVTNSNGCKNTAAFYWTNVTILNQIKPEISVYPNPTKGYLHIVGLEKETEVLVMTPEGKIVKKAVTKELLNIRDLSTGIYIIKLLDKEYKIEKEQ